MSEWITDLQSLVSQGRTFATIMGDPPWDFDNKVTRGATTLHYPTMPLDAIKAMPVADLAAKDSHLHLWATKDKLFHAKLVMDAWGFEYKSILVWDKVRMGNGNYHRIQTEFLLLGVRGEGMKHFRCKDWRNIVRIERGEYSRKPDEIRAMVEKASYGPYLELFAREQCEGWTSYGNQDQTFIPGTTTQPRCLMCGAPFPRRRSTGRYCGDRCRKRAQRQCHDKLGAMSR